MDFLAEEELDTSDKSIQDYLDAIWRRKKLAILTFAGIFLLVSIIAVVIPTVYRSQSTILIEQQEIPQDLVRSTVTSFADQRLQLIKQRVMTTSNLWGIIEKFSLYQEELEVDPREVVVGQMREDIATDMISANVIDPRTGRPTEATIAFRVAFQHESPQTALKVANELTSLYLNENLKNRREHAEQTSEFLTSELNRLQGVVTTLEHEIADFKADNNGKLPESMDVNLAVMERVEREILETERNIQSLREREIYLRSELLQVSPNSTVFTETGEKVLSPVARLRVLENQLIMLKAKYSKDHPDVKRVSREIKAVEDEIGPRNSAEEIQKLLLLQQNKLVELQERYSDSHPDVIHQKTTVQELQNSLSDALSAGGSRLISKELSDNPVYIQLQTQLKTAVAEIESLQSRKTRLEEKYNKYEGHLTDSPAVEKDYRSLLRDYENALAKYREIKAKQMEANISLAMESERKGERFTLIEPPLMPELPIKPNRIMILVIGFVFAIGGAIGVILLAEAVDDSVVGASGVLKVMGVPPLAAIPLIKTEEEKRTAKKYLLFGMLGVIGAFILFLTLIHFAYKPLDVLWFVILRKLGI